MHINLTKVLLVENGWNVLITRCKLNEFLIASNFVLVEGICTFSWGVGRTVCSDGEFSYISANKTHTRFSQKHLFINHTTTMVTLLTWWKGKPSGSRWNNSSHGFIEVVYQCKWRMPHHWHPVEHERNSIFKFKQQTLHESWGPETYNFTMVKYLR